VQKHCALPGILRFSLIGFYAYGAYVHFANMAGWTGFDWLTAPPKWQLLDVIYLAFDIAVIVGLAARKRLGLLLLILAASSQIMLYTAFRSWVLEVPANFEVDASNATYLDGLVLFHVVCLTAVGWAHWRARITSIAA